MSYKTVKQFSFLFFFFIIGFSIYLYLPIRSSQNPHYDWGNPETFENFIYHTTDRKDASVHFDVPKKNILSRLLVSYWNLYLENYSVFGILLGIVGLGYLIIKRKYALLSLFSLFFIPPFIFFIRYWTENSAFIPTFLILGIFMAIGIGAGISLLRRHVKETQRQEQYIALASVFLLAQFIFLFSNHYVRNSEKVDYWETSTIMKGIFDQLDPGGIIISYHAWFGFNYLQQIDGRRPDVTILSLPSFLVPKLFTEFEPSRFQDIVIPKTLPKEFGSAFLTKNINDHPIYWEPVVEYNELVARYLVPDGLVFRINSVLYELDDKAISSYLSNLSTYIRFDQISDDSEERSFYAQILSGHGTFFLERGVYEIALGHFKLASTMVPHQTQFLNMLGITYAYMEDYTQAEKNFLEAISIKPEDYEPYLNLGKMLMINKQLDEAEYYLKKVLDLFPNHLHAMFSLGTINSELGNKEIALDYFNEILELDQSNERVKDEIDQLLSKM